MSLSGTSAVSAVTGYQKSPGRFCCTIHATPASRTTPTLPVFVIRIGVSSRPLSSIQCVPVISPFPFPAKKAAKTLCVPFCPRGRMAVTPVRTGPLPTTRRPSPEISVLYPTSTPATSVIALSGPVAPSNGTPRSRARGCESCVHAANEQTQRTAHTIHERRFIGILSLYDLNFCFPSHNQRRNAADRHRHADRDQAAAESAIGCSKQSDDVGAKISAEIRQRIDYSDSRGCGKPGHARGRHRPERPHHGFDASQPHGEARDHQHYRIGIAGQQQSGSGRERRQGHVPAALAAAVGVLSRNHHHDRSHQEWNRRNQSRQEITDAREFANQGGQPQCDAVHGGRNAKINQRKHPDARAENCLPDAARLLRRAVLPLTFNSLIF